MIKKKSKQTTHSQIQLILNLEDEAQKQQHKGNFEEALENFEILLKMKKQNFGTQSKEFTQTCVSICNLCNIMAINLLKQQQFVRALELLKRSEILCDNNDFGKAVTYNNLACYYRKLGKLRTALQYLEKSLEIENTITYHPTKADTHLNLCAVLSQLNRHDLALHHAQCAIIIVQSSLLKAFLPQRARDVSETCEQKKENQDIEKNFKDRVAVLAIAYHNLGVEQEFLKMYQQSCESFRQAKEFSESYLGPKDGIAQHLTEIYKRAKGEIDIHMFKEEIRIKKKEGFQKRPRVMTAHHSRANSSNQNFSRPQSRYNQSPTRIESAKGMRTNGGRNLSKNKTSYQHLGRKIKSPNNEQISNMTQQIIESSHDLNNGSQQQEKKQKKKAMSRQGSFRFSNHNDSFIDNGNIGYQINVSNLEESKQKKRKFTNSDHIDDEFFYSSKSKRKSAAALQKPIFTFSDSPPPMQVPDIIEQKGDPINY